MITGIIGCRGQVTVPHAIRAVLNLKEGGRVAFIQNGNEVVLQPLTKTLLDVRGSIPTFEPQDFDAIRDHVIQEHVRKIAPCAS